MGWKPHQPSNWRNIDLHLVYVLTNPRTLRIMGFGKFKCISSYYRSRAKQNQYKVDQWKLEATKVRIRLAWQLMNLVNVRGLRLKRMVLQLLPKDHYLQEYWLRTLKDKGALYCLDILVQAWFKVNFTRSAWTQLAPSRAEKLS